MAATHCTEVKDDLVLQTWALGPTLVHGAMSCDKEADAFFLTRSEEEWKKMMELLTMMAKGAPCTPIMTKLLFKVTQTQTFVVVV